MFRVQNRVIRVKNRLDWVQEGGELNFKFFLKNGKWFKNENELSLKSINCTVLDCPVNNSVNRCSEYTAETLQIQSNNLLTLQESEYNQQDDYILIQSIEMITSVE